MADIDKVRDFISQNSDEYIKLLGIVRSACHKAKNEFTSGVVVDVYSRGDKQGTDQNKQELKIDGKILLACEKPVSFSRLKQIEDIIGITVVVQYPDETVKVLDRIKEILDRRNVIQIAQKPHTGAYVAEHRVFESGGVTHGGLRCEVQCKTVLHEAWSTKMHDLTYKPQGVLDDRIRGIVEAISTSLEGLERQSQIVRDMVNSRIKVEGRPFRLSLASFLRSMTLVLGPTWQATGTAARLRQLQMRLGDEFENLKSAPAEDAAVVSLAGGIRKAFSRESDMPMAWVLATQFAGARLDREAAIFLGELSRQYLDALPRLRERNQVTEQEIRSLPMGFYAVQDFDRALEVVDILLSARKPLKLSNQCSDLLKFNKATWLLERESVRPNKQKAREEIRADAHKLLKQCRKTIAHLDALALLDTEGLERIVFAERREQVLEGIDMCNRAGKTDDLDETEVAAAYAEWRTHVGWRRYFDVAEREDAGPAGL